MNQQQPQPEWPKYCYGPNGQRVRFDSADEVWPGYKEKPPAPKKAKDPKEKE